MGCPGRRSTNYRERYRGVRKSPLASAGLSRSAPKASDAAANVILERCPGRSMDDLRAHLGKGRPTAAGKVVRAQLEHSIFVIGEEKSATRKALAGALECDVATINRLRNKGRSAALEQQPS
jgi:hypothetical protein